MVASRLAAAQALAGHEVHLAAVERPDRREVIRKSVEGVPGFDQIVQHPIAPPGKAERILGYQTKAFLQPVTQNIDVAHLHGVWETILRVVATHCRRMGKPYLLMPHGMLDPWSLGQKKLKKKIALALGYRTMLNGAAALHLLNADERRLIDPLKLICPTVVIPNGIFLEEVEPLPPAGSFYGRHPELSGRPYILFLSRLHYKKGLDYLGDAFAEVAQKLPEVQLVVVGPDDGAQAQFEAAVTQAGLQNRVHIIGPLYGKDKLAAIVDARCFCLPSRQEGFSVAIAEAMACGVPVVISDACHFPEVAEVGAGIVVKLDASAVADGLVRVLSDPAAARKMGQAGRELITTRYTWPSIAQQTLAAYDRAMQTTPLSYRTG